MLKYLFLQSFLVMLITGCGVADNKDREDSNDDEGRGSTNRPVTVDQLPRYYNTQMFRDPGTIVYTYADEAAFFNPSNESRLPITLNPIPQINVHDQDSRTIRVNDANDCGSSIGNDPTIKRRISDCQRVNSSDKRSYYWNAQENGIAGEGDWRLVAHKNGESVWLDETTGLLWSSNVGKADWMQASGNTNEAERICKGSSDGRFLGISADEVQWRLPTRNDYLLADINGARFVLSSDVNGDSSIYWTANFISGEGEAWAIEHNTGILSTQKENKGLSVRCVGVVIK